MIGRSLQDARDALHGFLSEDENATRILAVAGAMCQAVQTGGKILACGNGGSACDAMHFCEEMTGRFRADRPPLPAVACIDPGHLTCTANDYGFDQVFSRWVYALGKAGDVLVVLSTSGNSPNVVGAVTAAGERGLVTVALLGGEGGRLAGRCDHEWIVPGRTPDRIQEIHMLILHCLIEAVEHRLFPGSCSP